MNNMIKHRLVQLNRGEIPEGYKKTDFGVFPCDWGSKQLNQLLDFKNGVNADKDMYHSGVKMISVNDILTDYPIVYDSIQGQVDIDEDTLKEFGVTYGDILFQRSSETFEDAGKSNVYLDQDKTATYSGFVIRGKKKSEYDPFYLNEALRIRQVRKQIIRRAAGSQHINVGQDSLATVVIPFASQLEQSRIAEILMKWDEAVGLYQQQIEKLNKLKKAALANLFPQKGQTAPKYRFAGFTAPWEQRKLGEICQVTMGQSPDGSTYSEAPSDYILVQGNADLKDGWVLPRIWTTQKTKTAEAGDLIMSVRAPAGAMGKTAYNVVLGRGVAGIKGNEFIYQSLVKMDFDGYWKKLAAGSTFESINSDVVNGAELVVPQDIAEQDRIGKYFNSLDNLITLHQRKCEMIRRQRMVLQHYLLNGIVRVHT